MPDKITFYPKIVSELEVDQPTHEDGGGLERPQADAQERQSEAPNEQVKKISASELEGIKANFNFLFKKVFFEKHGKVIKGIVQGVDEESYRKYGIRIFEKLAEIEEQIDLVVSEALKNVFDNLPDMQKDNFLHLLRAGDISAVGEIQERMLINQVSNVSLEVEDQILKWATRKVIERL